MTVYSMVIDIARRLYPMGFTSAELVAMSGRPINASGAICMAHKRGNLRRADGMYYWNPDGPLGCQVTDEEIVAYAPRATSLYDLATRVQVGRDRARAALAKAGITTLGPRNKPFR